MEDQENQQSAAKIDDPQPLEGEYYPGREMFELEKERIRSADKRTDIARLAIEANDAADKRMYDYHMSKLEREAGFKEQQITVAARLL